MYMKERTSLEHKHHSDKKKTYHTKQTPYKTADQENLLLRSDPPVPVSRWYRCTRREYKTASDTEDVYNTGIVHRR